MSITVLITIDGTSYDDDDRPEIGLEISRLHRSLEGYDELHWTQMGGSPIPFWGNGQAVELQLNSTVWFNGIITHVSHPSASEYGWAIGYTAAGGKFVADRVAFTAPDGTGSYTYNRTPDDSYYIPAESGLTLGQIITDILTIPANATALDAAGIAYTSLTPPTLPTATTTDLASLNVVPPQPVHVSGPNLFNYLTQLIQRWMPTWLCEVLPDGTIRFKDTHDLGTFVPKDFTIPGGTSVGDPIEWPHITRDTSQCYTRLRLRGGPNVAVALLSQADGTLAKVWTSPQQSSWTLSDFLAPKDASDNGTIASVTSTSLTYTSSDNTKTWAANFWSGRQARVYLLDPLATGIQVSEVRQVTSNTALTAGGTCTITWDSSQPISHTAYSQARLVGTAGGENNVGRLFTVREPSTGHTGLSTYIGAHLVEYYPLPVTWANNTQSLNIFYATGTVVAAGGSSIPWTVQAIPSTGDFLFSQPVVMAYASTATLNAGYPTTTGAGLPADVQVLALYSLGALSVTVPADISGVPQYQGTAYTQDGIELTKYLDLPEWIDGTGVTQMTDLAQQFLDSISDSVVEGAFTYYDPDLSTWDFLTFGTAVNFLISGISSPWSDINAPIREVQMDWGQGAEGHLFKVSFTFSTRRRPFSGYDLYTHPAFRGGSVISGIEGDGLSLQDYGVSAPHVAGAYGSMTPGEGASLENYGMQSQSMGDLALGGTGGGGMGPGASSPFEATSRSPSDVASAGFQTPEAMMGSLAFASPEGMMGQPGMAMPSQMAQAGLPGGMTTPSDIGAQASTPYAQVAGFGDAPSIDAVGDWASPETWSGSATSGGSDEGGDTTADTPRAAPKKEHPTDAQLHKARVGDRSDVGFGQAQDAFLGGVDREQIQERASHKPDAGEAMFAQGAREAKERNEREEIRERNAPKEAKQEAALAREQTHQDEVDQQWQEAQEQKRQEERVDPDKNPPAPASGLGGGLSGAGGSELMFGD